MLRVQDIAFRQKEFVERSASSVHKRLLLHLARICAIDPESVSSEIQGCKEKVGTNQVGRASFLRLATAVVTRSCEAMGMPFGRR